MCPTSCARTVVVGMADHVATAVTVSIGWRNAQFHTTGAGAIVVGIADHISTAVTVTMGWLNAVSVTSSAGAVVVSMANHSAILVTITMGWRRTIHSTLVTIIVTGTSELETSFKDSTTRTSCDMCRFGSCTGCHMNSHCGHVIITEMKTTILIPGFKFQSKRSTGIGKGKWVWHNLGNLRFTESISMNVFTTIRTVSRTIPSKSRVSTVAEVKVTVRILLCPPITITIVFKRRYCHIYDSFCCGKVNLQ